MVSDIPAPKMAAFPIYTPTFNTELGPVRAGTAFLATDPSTDAVYLLSAHHLLGEAGGMSRDLTWDEVSNMVHSVTCEPDVDGFEPMTLTEIVPIVGATGMDDQTGANDLLVFRAPDSLRKYAIPLRMEPILEDEPVWLYAWVQNSEELHKAVWAHNSGGFLHLAVVNVSNEHYLEYSYQEDIDLQATSGAPVVDSQGRLAAVNLGGYSFAGVVGLGNPVTEVKKHLDRIENQSTDSKPRESPQ